MKKYSKMIKMCVTVSVVLSAGIFYSCTLPQSQKAIVFDGKEEQDPLPKEDEQQENDAEQAGKSDEQKASDRKTEIYVYVSGCVKNPGVYRLGADSRIYQAVDAAGGMTKKADRQACNLAGVLQDEMHIHIPSKEEDGGSQKETDMASGSETGQSPQININTASKEELMTLSGIGEVKAEAIIAYRQSHGAFSQVSDLMKVDGIKEGSYEKIQDSICVE